MRTFANLSLQKRIALFVLSALSIGLGLVSWLGVKALNESTEKILDERLTIARIMANRLDETLTHVLSHMRSAANSSDRLPTGEEFVGVANALRRIAAESDIYLRNIFLCDKNGRVVGVEPNGPIAGSDMFQYAEVRRVFETGTPSVSNFINNPLMEGEVVLATVPVFAGTGEILGVLASSIDIERSGIRAFSQTIPVGNTGYIEIVDGNGFVLARTDPGLPLRSYEQSDHPGRFSDLIKRGKTTVGTCHRCHEVNEGLQRRRDVLAFAPLSVASWGVAIRQSEEEALAPTWQLETRLFVLGIVVVLVTFFLVWIVVQGIVSPIRILTASAKKVAAGNFKAAAPVRRGDEIGELSTAFYTMTRELAKSKNELLSRNEELSALNSIAATVGQSLNLEDVLGNALTKVLEITGTKTGCVFLMDPDSKRHQMRRYGNASGAFRCQDASPTSLACACRQVLRNGQTMMVNDISQCPLLDDPAMIREDANCFISLPLKSKNSTLGVMNIACSRERSFNETDFKLLDSVGYHVGLAIENSVLYEEARQKEQLRGQLLSRIIGAHEEERKHIARELHDETIQTLALLSRRLDNVPERNPFLPSEVIEEIQRAKHMAEEAVKELRDFARGLRPPILDDLGIVPCIRRLLVDATDRTGAKGHFNLIGRERRLPPDIEVGMFRIAQEALWNVERHSKATDVVITVTLTEHEARLDLKDNGVGFDMPPSLTYPSAGARLGLVGMQERAESLGGKLQIRSIPGSGTAVTVVIPVPENVTEELHERSY